MTGKERILVGIDGSEDAIRAARLAVKVARMLNATLTLAMIENPEDYAVTVERESLLKAKEELMWNILQTAKNEIAEEGVEIDTMIDVGNPALKLAEMAKNGYDMVVVSRKGLGATKSLFMGSVSVRLVQHSVVPVLVVP
ncbi:MAG: universal stress protein [Methanomassiliicoccales archaeon]|nr:universal stress protein [Methanomassiliicoccales archaeon]